MNSLYYFLVDMNPYVQIVYILALTTIVSLLANSMINDWRMNEYRKYIKYVIGK